MALALTPLAFRNSILGLCPWSPSLLIADALQGRLISAIQGAAEGASIF